VTRRELALALAAVSAGVWAGRRADRWIDAGSGVLERWTDMDARRLADRIAERLKELEAR
jgi:hypothetical protein